MKILIAMDGYFPGQKFGGPPVSTDNFCSLMCEHECYIVTKNHDLDEKTPYPGIVPGEWVERENCKVTYFDDSEYRVQNFEKIIIEIQPDAIYLQSLFDDCVLFFLMLAKKYNIKVLLAPRGQLCAGAFKKKYKKIPYILILRLFGYIKHIYCQSTSDEETEAIHKYLQIPRERILFLTNVPSIPSQKDFQYPEKESGSAKFVFLSRIHPKKNLLKAVNLLKDIQGNVIFDVYGSLEDEAYWEKCQKEAKNYPDSFQMNYRGLISHDQVHETFSNYDAFIFPSFSENYGHVIVEALISGCPAIISDQTPWEDLEENEAGWVYALENEAGFRAAIQTIVDVDSNRFKESAKKYAQKKLNIEGLKKNYKNAFEQIVNKC